MGEYDPLGVRPKKVIPVHVAILPAPYNGFGGSRKFPCPTTLEKAVSSTKPRKIILSGAM